MKRALAILVLVAATAPAAAQELGRLFFTEEQRAALDARRRSRVPDKPGAVSHIFGPLADASINVDMIIQNVGRDKGETDVTFTVPRTDLARAQALLEDRRGEIGFNRVITDAHVAKISVVGVGMKSHAGVAATMFKALADRGINVQAISTSEIKVSVLIDEDETELAVRVLHTAYEMDATEAA